MTFRRFASLLLPFLLLSNAAVARQETRPAPKKPDKETQEKALAALDETLRDVRGLRLPENRARMLTLAGNALWEIDARRARAIFREAVGNLGQALRAISPHKPQEASLTYSAQQEIFQTIAQRDAMLARDLLKTLPQPTQGSENDWNREFNRQIEMQVAIQAIYKDHTQASQIAEESFAKGFSHDLLNLLEELESKDEAATERLASKILERLRGANLRREHSAANLAVAWLQRRLYLEATANDGGQTQDGAARRTLGLDSARLRALAEICMAAALPDPDDQEAALDLAEGSGLVEALESLLPQLETIVPAQAAELRARAEQNQPSASRPTRWESFEKGMETGSIETQLEIAREAPPDLRDGMFYQIAMRLMNEGDMDGARKILNEHVVNEIMRRDALAHVNRLEMSRAITSGKLEQARQMAAKLESDDERLTAFVQMANTALQKKDRKLARQLADEARGLAGAMPANSTQMHGHIMLANLYNRLETTQGFEMIESMVHQINGLMAAVAMLDGFEPSSSFYEGEMRFNMSHAVCNLAVKLAHAGVRASRVDFDRALRFADQFQRHELRLLARLLVIHGLLSDDNPTFSGIY